MFKSYWARILHIGLLSMPTVTELAVFVECVLAK